MISVKACRASEAQFRSSSPRVLMLRIGLIGFGMAGRVFHAPLISSVDGLELAAVVERHGDQAAQRYPGVKIYRSLEELLADSSIDLVVVATPSGTHFQVAKQALAARKHVVVDKPVSVTSDEIAQLIELARANGKLLIPFHNRRWDGDFLTVQKLLHEHQLGRIVHLESRFDRWNPGATRRPWKDDPEQGGGVLLDLGTHLVDQALVLCGKPLAISADVLRERDGEGSDDAFTIRLRYEKCFVTLGANALSAPAGARFHIRGTRGNFRKKGVDPQEAALNKITRIPRRQLGPGAADRLGPSLRGCGRRNGFTAGRDCPRRLPHLLCRRPGCAQWAVRPSSACRRSLARCPHP